MENRSANRLPRRGQGRLREDRWDVASAFPAGLQEADEPSRAGLTSG